MSRVGIFDSGVGGLSVWREIAARYPALETVYVADQAHIPYGPRELEEIRDFSRAITRFLLDQGCGTIVLACNTASAAALAALRAELPAVPFVGMEPAVKPAAATSKSRVAGVLATPATFQGALFATTVERFASGVHLVRQVCPGLVERIEAGDLDGEGTAALLRECLAPSLAAGADTIVLACTHYPFLIETIRRMAGPGVSVIDPAPAVARHLGTVLDHHGLRRVTTHAGEHLFVTTGDPARFADALFRLTGVQGCVEAVGWQEGSLASGARAA